LGKLKFGKTDELMVCWWHQMKKQMRMKN